MRIQLTIENSPDGIATLSVHLGAQHRSSHSRMSSIAPDEELALQGPRSPYFEVIAFDFNLVIKTLGVLRSWLRLMAHELAAPDDLDASYFQIVNKDLLDHALMDEENKGILHVHHIGGIVNLPPDPSEGAGCSCALGEMSSQFILIQERNLPRNKCRRCGRLSVIMAPRAPIA